MKQRRTIAALRPTLYLVGAVVFGAPLFAGCASPVVGDACGPGFDQCGGMCVDLSTDPLHCGACDHACTSEQACIEGRCIRYTEGFDAGSGMMFGTDAGATVFVPMYDPKEMDRFAFRDHDRVHTRVGLDFTMESTVQKYYAERSSLYASIHLAGGFSMSPIAETSLDDFLQLMNMNAVTCFLSCREAVKAIRRSNGEGRIVNVTAKPTLVPTAGMAAYTASKSVVNALTLSLAEELAQDEIWVNAVAPSIMNTRANREAMPKAKHDQWPSVADVAETVVHLASPSNRVARGAIVPVYGRS